MTSSLRIGAAINTLTSSSPMELHGNARLTPHGRTVMCRRVRDEGWTIAGTAEAAGCSERTCYRWLAHYDAAEPITDRPSAPKTVPGRTDPSTGAMIEQLRIGAELGLAT